MDEGQAGIGGPDCLSQFSTERKVCTFAGEILESTVTNKQKLNMNILARLLIELLNPGQECYFLLSYLCRQEQINQQDDMSHCFELLSFCIPRNHSKCGENSLDVGSCA